MSMRKTKCASCRNVAEYSAKAPLKKGGYTTILLCGLCCKDLEKISFIHDIKLVKDKT